VKISPACDDVASGCGEGVVDAVGGRKEGGTAEEEKGKVKWARSATGEESS